MITACKIMKISATYSKQNDEMDDFRCLVTVLIFSWILLMVSPWDSSIINWKLYADTWMK